MSLIWVNVLKAICERYIYRSEMGTLWALLEITQPETTATFKEICS